MRRKCRRGIYTNKTIKKCPTCTIVCGTCKGACKVCHGFALDDDCVADWHLGYEQKQNWIGKDRKLHRMGVGSLQKGKKFIFYNTNSHKHDRESLKAERKKDRLRKEKIEDDINHGLLVIKIDKINKDY